MRIRMLAMIGCAVVLAAPGDAWATDCAWNWVNPNPPRVTVNRADYAVGRFVAVGSDGLVLTSSDGERWTPRESGTSADLYGIDVASQRWVAVGQGVVISSRDSETWTRVFDDPQVVFQDVEFGASRFVAVGEGLSGDILTSLDGDHWTRVPTLMPDPVHGVVWAGDSFFACSSNEIYRSVDGLQWHAMGTVPQTAKGYLFSFERADLAWAGNRLIWIGGTEAWISDDGEDWSWALTVDGCAELSAFVGVLAFPQTVVLSGYGACPSGNTMPEAQLYTSFDGGLTWAETYRDLAGGFPALVHSPGAFFALGDGGDLLASNDAQTWSCGGSGCTSNACADGFSDVTVFGNDILAAGGVGLCGDTKRLGGGTIAGWTEAEGWQVVPLDTEIINGLSAGAVGQDIVAVGDGWAASSADGRLWQLHEIPTTRLLEAVTWGPDTFVAVGVEGVMLSSPDGVAWSPLWSRTEQDLMGVAWGGDRFVAVGGAGTIVWSHDALNWEIGATSSQTDLHGVAKGGDVWLGVGEEGTILESTDGIHWFEVITGLRARLRGVAWNGQVFAVVGSDEDSSRAVVMVSPDGRHWTNFPVEAPHLRNVVAAGETFVAVGDDRALVVSSCIGTLAALDPQVVFLPLGESRALTLTLDQPVAADRVMMIDLSAEGVVDCPAEVVVSDGSESVEIPLRALEVGEAWITVTLPDRLGGGAARARVEVVPAGPATRRPSGRRSP